MKYVTTLTTNANTDNFQSAGFCALGTSHSSMTGNSTSNVSFGSFDGGDTYADAVLNFVSVDGDLA